MARQPVGASRAALDNQRDASESVQSLQGMEHGSRVLVGAAATDENPHER
jgi:hypothetical protein